MPVDGTQPVYPPQTLTPITSVWGQAVSDSVVQKFASTTDRTNKWVNPPEGSLSTIVGSGIINIYRAGAWRRLQEMAVVPTAALVPYTAVPPVSANIITTAGVWSGNSSAIGQITVNFALPFPNGVLAVNPTPTNGCNYFAFPGHSAITQNGFVAYCFSGTGQPVLSASIEVTYIAVGW